MSNLKDGIPSRGKLLQAEESKDTEDEDEELINMVPEVAPPLPTKSGTI